MKIIPGNAKRRARKMKKILLASFLAAVLFLCGCNKSLSRSNVLDPNYNAGGTGFVEGYVKDASNANIFGAALNYNGSLYTSTDNSGHYSFSSAPAGNLPLTASCNWYASATQNVTLYPNNSMRNVNFVLQSGRPSTYFPCNFDSLSQGSLGSPWLTSTTGTGQINVGQTSGITHSGLQTCKMSTWAAADDAQIKYTGLNALKGAKASAWVYSDNYSSASTSLKLQDSNGSGPEIGIVSGQFYYKNNNGGQITLGVGISASTWYQFAVSYETDTSTILLTINNTSGNIYFNQISPTTYIPSLDRLVIENKGTAAGNANAYIDDVDLVKK